MTREEIEKFSEVEPFCIVTDEERWYEVGCIDGLKANLEILWHDACEEPQEYPILCRDKQNNVWIESDLDPYVDGWDECVEFNEIVSWVYINDLLLSYNKTTKLSIGE